LRKSDSGLSGFYLTSPLQTGSVSSLTLAFGQWQQRGSGCGGVSLSANFGFVASLRKLLDAARVASSAGLRTVSKKAPMTSIYSRPFRSHFQLPLLLLFLVLAVFSNIVNADTAPGGEVHTITPIAVQMQSPTTSGTVTSGSVHFDSSKITLTPSSTVKPQKAEKLEVMSGANPDLLKPAKYGTYGPRGDSRPLCGGIVDGKLQEPCDGKVAKFESDAVGKCAPGSFFDVGTWSCFSCPTGYKRSLASVASERACQQPDGNAQGKLTSATLRGTACPKGSFFDPTRGGECWTCPTDYKRSTAPVEWKDACVKPADKKFASTSKKGSATGLLKANCPAGQFAKQGSCYACPSGYKRTLNGLESDKACFQDVKREISKATVVKQAACEPGEIRDKLRDPKHGGECWTCPTAAARTVYPVNGPQACQVSGKFKYAQATKTDALSCPAGQMFDLVNSKNPKVMALIRAQGGSFPADLGKGGGGSCWSCPAGYTRTMTAAWSPEACKSIGTDWRSATYTQPGLFGLDGAEEVVLEILTKRPELITEIAKSIAPSLKLKSADVIRDTWEEIATHPEDSGVLTTAVYSRLQAAAAQPAQASAAEKRLLASFSEAIGHLREFIAQEALSAGEVWQKTKLVKKAQSRTIQQGDATVLFTDLPNFEDITASAVLGGLTVGSGLSALAVTGIVKTASMKTIFPFRNHGAKAAAKAAGEKAAKVVLKEFSGEATEKIMALATKAAAKASAKALSGTGSAMLKIALSGGASLLIEVVSEFVVLSVDKALQEANLIPTLKAKLATAQQKVDVARLLATSDGADELDSQWGIMLTEATPPKNPDAIAQKARGAAAASLATANAEAEKKAAQIATATANAPKFLIASLGQNGQCLDESGNAAAMKPCTVNTTRWSVGANATLLSSNSQKCLSAGNPVSVSNCSGKAMPTQQWKLNGKAIQSGTGLCLNPRGTSLVVEPCNAAMPTQLWQVTVK
jgi:hypothetical protein